MSSGFVINDSDRIDFSFSDITIIHSTEVFFIGKGTRYGKWYAFKGLNSKYRKLDAYVSMLGKEFELLLTLDHPQIRKAYTFEDIAGFGPCIIMEYFDSQTLNQWLETPRQLRDRMRVAFEIGEALIYIHAMGIVHRDIKPSNILITRIGQSVKIIDFGLSDSDKYSVLKYPAGTPEYIAPEQEAGGVADPRNDIYSYGRILCDLLPERKFRPLIRQCINKIDDRPPDVATVLRRLRKIYVFSRILPIALAAACVLILVILFILPHDKSISPIKQTQILSSPSYIAEAEKKDKDSSIAAYEIINETPTSSVHSLSENTSDENIYDDSDLALRHASIKKECLTGGIRTIGLVWENTAEMYLDTVSNLDLPERWNTKVIEHTKNNYLENIKYLARNSDTGDFYLLSDRDILEIERIIDAYIEEKQQEWIRNRNLRISNL